MYKKRELSFEVCAKCRNAMRKKDGELYCEKGCNAGYVWQPILIREKMNDQEVQSDDEDFDYNEAFDDKANEAGYE